ncbi:MULTISPECIES: MerR family DNA-binding protein [unclassified Sphingomonas]|uniref:MerR family transcriptional regulator n=1 Tax=unclassified Sphingomonas TaxID=196159 RepID=UPI00226A23C9|nr:MULTISPECIES: MerR family DNA-binding protein [unclassified Sphingomonas]
MATMTIAGLAREGGVGVETIRYYQRRGLLPEPPRTGGSGLSGGIRRYDTEAVKRLRFIRSAQAAGFTLEEIGELLSLDATDDRPRARTMARGRIAALDEKIRELEAAKVWLTRLADECSASIVGRCPILEAFEAS